jgi:hypothetical protein
MPSQLHESLLLLFRNRPDWLLLREALHVQLPDYTDVRVVSADLTDIQPAEYRADLVVRCGGASPAAADRTVWAASSRSGLTVESGERDDRRFPAWIRRLSRNNSTVRSRSNRAGRARADIALFDRTAFCVLDGGEHIVGADVAVAAANAVEVPVISFADTGLMDSTSSLPGSANM